MRSTSKSLRTRVAAISPRGIAILGSITLVSVGAVAVFSTAAADGSSPSAFRSVVLTTGGAVDVRPSDGQVTSQSGSEFVARYLSAGTFTVTVAGDVSTDRSHLVMVANASGSAPVVVTISAAHSSFIVREFEPNGSPVNSSFTFMVTQYK
jgi:hypothetical protein